MTAYYKITWMHFFHWWDKVEFCGEFSKLNTQRCLKTITELFTAQVKSFLLLNTRAFNCSIEKLSTAQQLSFQLLKNSAFYSSIEKLSTA